jgi:hypothetical protein
MVRVERTLGFEAMYREQGPAVRTFVHRRIDPGTPTRTTRGDGPFPRIGTVRIYLLVSRTSATGRVELADPGWAQAQAIGPNDARTRSPRFYPRRYQPQAVTVEPLTSTDGASSDRELALSVVDSGVTHVGWTYAAADGSSKKITIHARVTNNVAFALVKRPLGRLLHAEWSGPNFYPHHREHS